MIILDTNVISEAMRPVVDASVTAWLLAQWGGDLFTTTVSEAEILYGIALLPDGRRKRGLRDEVRSFFDEDMADRVLPFDREAAGAYATIAAGLRAAGRGFDTSDVQIAAIAQAHGFSVATRNVRHFSGCGIEVINPFEPTPH